MAKKIPPKTKNETNAQPKSTKEETETPPRNGNDDYWVHGI